jgi:hypothetical protein
MLLVGTLVLTPAVFSITLADPYSGHFKPSKGLAYGTIASIQSGDTGKAPHMDIIWTLGGLI